MIDIKCIRVKCSVGYKSICITKVTDVIDEGFDETTASNLQWLNGGSASGVGVGIRKTINVAT